MVNEDALSYKRGDLVEFRLSLGGGPKRCTGLILNTAVAFGRCARQVWILDIDDASPELQAAWTAKKHLVLEGDILCLLSTVLIGRDTLLLDNPVCYPVHDVSGLHEIPAVMVSIPFPKPQPATSAE